MSDNDHVNLLREVFAHIERLVVEGLNQTGHGNLTITYRIRAGRHILQHDGPAARQFVIGGEEVRRRARELGIDIK